MKSVNGELTETKEEDRGEARDSQLLGGKVKLLLFELLQKRINARRHRHYFSMEEKVTDRLLRRRIRQRRQIRRRPRQRRPKNSSVSSDLITVEFEINLGTLKFRIGGERE
ncbi:hypothetical protein IGI04_018939 [Brassica rapa subsp. trilocularis]|uniref:Uncharacterized protein n=1 Tax=Brassica rapa subsp. trilocularis TaxID=1813537 RepID=A0ABQ7MEF1_BRACM|nr:hypothetical protein IGI04_018939 [Brassica rapa subsp. trilocularis]